MHIPCSETARPAVERALATAFGTTELDSVSPLAGGMSGARLHRIRVGGVPYVLRIEGSTDAFRNPERWYACMRIAAEACLAPGVRYASPTDGVAIMDFVPQRSLTLDYAGDKADLMVELAQTVRALHETSRFPPLMDYLDAMDILVGQFRASGAVSSEILDEPLARYGEVAAIYRRLPDDLVSSHNDLNPRNVLYDGRRLWLVDWEAAFLADRYVDLAAMINFFATNVDEAEVALRAYFRGEPDAAQRARLFLARQISHVFYAVMFLSGAAAEKPGAALSPPRADTPSLGELHAAVSLGEPILESCEGRAAYGLAHLAACAENLKGRELAPALAALGAA